MARPTVIRDEEILKVAREIFLQKGASLTTAEVARRAGVAEGSIFRRYKTKYALIRAALLSSPPPIMDVLQLLRTQELPDSLVELGVRMVGLGRKILPVVMVMWSNRSEYGLPRELASDLPPQRIMAELARYFDEQVEKGKLRSVDTRALSQAYFGALQSFTLLEVIQGRKPLPPEELRAFVRKVVRVLWEGAAPEREA